MQKMTNNKEFPTFFAAANGYSGFRSYFPEVFNSESFERTFILKGGPGTGKSSLMRQVADYGAENGFDAELILCSSDPHSLDGVILEKAERRFCVLDGTAPHTRDTELPGAFDEIVNLGENWSTDTLTKNRKLISELVKKKKSGYALAYRQLANAGKIKEIERELLLPSVDIKTIENDTKSLAEELFSDEVRGLASTRLVDSFGRFGRFRLSTLDKSAECVIRVFDSGIAGEIFMSSLLSALKNLGAAMTVFPTVFSDGEIEGILLTNTKTAVILSDSPAPNINTEQYVKKNPNVTVPKETEALRSSFLDEAQKHFALASDLHFELEKIYIGSMNFSANNSVFEKIVEKIENGMK